jgi:hypothetical protein
LFQLIAVGNLNARVTGIMAIDISAKHLVQNFKTIHNVYKIPIGMTTPSLLIWLMSNLKSPNIIYNARVRHKQS